MKQQKKTQNKSVETNRRPASPLNAGRKFVSAACAPPFVSAAVAHLGVMWVEPLRWLAVGVLGLLFAIVVVTNAVLAFQTLVRTAPPYPSLIPAVGVCILALIDTVGPITLSTGWILALLVADQGSLPFPMHMAIGWWKRRRLYGGPT